MTDANKSSTPIVELHALAVAKVMAAWDETDATRGDFEARASDGLAQVFQIVALDIAEAHEAGREEALADAVRALSSEHDCRVEHGASTRQAGGVAAAIGIVRRLRVRR